MPTARCTRFEENVVWRVAELLGVSTRERVELRREFRDAAAPAPTGPWSPRARMRTSDAPRRGHHRRVRRDWRGACRIFAANGHELALVARRGDRLEALADEIAANGAVRPLPIELDLTTEGAAETLSELLGEAGLTPRFLVNNAGFGLLGRAIELDAAEQLAIVDLNMRALTALTLRFLPAIVAAKGGVLNVASVAAFMPGPGFAVYYATKAYVRSFSEALSQELKPLGGEGGLPVSRSGANRLSGARRLGFFGRHGRDEARDAAGGGSRASGLRGSDGRQARADRCPAGSTACSFGPRR